MSAQGSGRHSRMGNEGDETQTNSPAWPQNGLHTQAAAGPHCTSPSTRAPGPSWNALLLHQATAPGCQSCPTGGRAGARAARERECLPDTRRGSAAPRTPLENVLRCAGQFAGHCYSRGRWLQGEVGLP
ncbi:unnamed protein product [Caretta caretta]